MEEPGGLHTVQGVAKNWTWLETEHACTINMRGCQVKWKGTSDLEVPTVGEGFPGGFCLLMQEMWVRSLGWKGPLEEEMAPYSSGKGAEIMAG